MVLASVPLVGQAALSPDESDQRIADTSKRCVQIKAKPANGLALVRCVREALADLPPGEAASVEYSVVQQMDELSPAHAELFRAVGDAETKLRYEQEAADLQARRKRFARTMVGTCGRAWNGVPEPQIGMTPTQAVICGWGQPDMRNVDRYAYKTVEQWVYRRLGYVYFENGRVVSIHEKDR